jgi:protein subunit release factor B
MRTRIFSVTIDDCRVETFTAGGKGGQNQNRVRSGVRVIHEPSGARGEARDSRDQPRNKQAAFKRMAETQEFTRWLRNQIARITGQETIEEKVERQMMPHNIRIEVVREGKWHGA